MRYALAELMKQKGVSYREVSQATRISTSTLYGLIHDTPEKIGTHKVIGRLLDYFGVTPNELILPGPDGRYGDDPHGDQADLG